jgi:AcrR family transcriptional regulator
MEGYAMPEKNPVEPRQKIYSAALELFAQKGFSAVGVREIAQKACVNVSMISYYFTNKLVLLKEILNTFYIKFMEVLKPVEYPDKTPDQRITMLVRNIVDFIRNNTKLGMVFYNELALDIPELNELKVLRTGEFIRMSNSFLHQLHLDPHDLYYLSMIAPGLIAIIINNFRILPVLEKNFHIKINDYYFQDYVDVLSSFFVEGIKGAIKKISEIERRKRKHEDG